MAPGPYLPGQFSHSQAHVFYTYPGRPSNLTVVAGQDPQLLALLVVIQTDGARVVRVDRLVKLHHRQGVERPLRQPVPREATVVGPAPVQLATGGASDWYGLCTRSQL